MSGRDPAGTLVLPGIDRPSHEYVYSTHSRMYLREGEAFRLWMNPLLYMRQDTPGAELTLTESERRRLIVSLLQERLRKLLYVFLHGHALPELARILFVFGDRSSDRLAAEIRALDFLGRELRDFPEVSFKESREALKVLLRAGRLPIPAVAEAIALVHRELAPVLAEGEPGGIRHRVNEVPEFDEAAYLARDATYLRPTVELARFLRREAQGLLRSAYLHGSLATLDYVPGFSDTETLLVVSRETSMDADRLLRLRDVVARSMTYLYRVDPFQHHGHFVVNELDFDYYPQGFLPIVLFDYAKAFFGGEAFPVTERDSSFERRRAVWDLCYYSRRRYLEGSSPRNFYEWKAHLGTVLLIPTAYLAARGIYVYKRDSFARAAPDFSPEAWEVIERATAVRQSWTPSRNPALSAIASRGSGGFTSGFWPWFAGHAGGHPRDAKGTSEREGARRAFVFAEAALEKLKEDGVL